ncbi:MAG: hypothetical protein GY828_03440, partial [Candidatus Gracilibacteria bacterium]|nr:hypothetical protein [Candidatus Gracilibacteria bacterium]
MNTKTETEIETKIENFLVHLKKTLLEKADYELEDEYYKIIKSSLFKFSDINKLQEIINSDMECEFNRSHNVLSSLVE